MVKKEVHSDTTKIQLKENAAMSDVEKIKERILEWSNPVEFVNNMYGSHPDDGGEYFKMVFKI